MLIELTLQLRRERVEYSPREGDIWDVRCQNLDFARMGSFYMRWWLMSRMSRMSQWIGHRPLLNLDPPNIFCSLNA